MESPTPSQVVAVALGAYVNNRKAFYYGLTIESLMNKDVMIYALKGAGNSEGFVREAFQAMESSSEETVMGNTLQTIIKELAGSGVIDAGDLMAERDGCLYVIEVKSQENTFNAASLAQTIRSLQHRSQHYATLKTPKKRPVKALIGILRGPLRDETRTYRAPRGRSENGDIDGFAYRYLVGPALWQWLTGAPSIAHLVGDLSGWANEVAEARNSCLDSLVGDLQVKLFARGLNDTREDILTLWHD